MGLWRRIGKLLQTDVMDWVPMADEAVREIGERGEKAWELLETLTDDENLKEFPAILQHMGSLLDVLDNPLVETATKALPLVPVVTGTLKLIREVTQQEPTLKDAVAVVAQAAYVKSFQQFLAANEELQERLQRSRASEATADRLRRLDDEDLTESAAQKVLICFHESDLAKQFAPILVARFVESGLPEAEARIAAERIARSTHRHMKQVVAEVPDGLQRLDKIYGDGWLRDLEAYESIDRYLEEAIASQPQEKVFDEEFALQDVYVPLRVKPVQEERDGDRAAALPIEEWAEKLLTDDTKQEQVLFLQGGPGRGKSVFCKMFADKVRRRLHPIWTPILIRLRHIATYRDFEKTLTQAVDWVCHERRGLAARSQYPLFVCIGRLRRVALGTRRPTRPARISRSGGAIPATVQTKPRNGTPGRYHRAAVGVIRDRSQDAFELGTGGLAADGGRTPRRMAGKMASDRRRGENRSISRLFAARKLPGTGARAGARTVVAISVGGDAPRRASESGHVCGCRGGRSQGFGL